jgi:hypothetical protein
VVDTIKAKVFPPVSFETERLGQLASQFWRVSSVKRARPDMHSEWMEHKLQSPCGRVRLICFADLDATGKSGRPYLTKVETELPALLFGHSGQLIGSQEELEQAVRMLRRVAGEATQQPISSDTDLELWWIDLVWHFRDPIDGWCSTWSTIGRAGGRQAPVVHEGYCALPGKELSFACYDKIRQLRKRKFVPCATAPCTRLEMRLRGSKLKSILGEGNEVLLDKLQWDDLYDAFRLQVRQLAHPAAGISNPAGRYRTEVALFNRLGPGERLRDVLIHEAGMRPRTVPRIVSYVRGLTRVSSEVLWDKVLPKAGPLDVPSLTVTEHLTKDHLWQKREKVRMRHDPAYLRDSRRRS